MELCSHKFIEIDWLKYLKFNKQSFFIIFEGILSSFLALYLQFWFCFVFGFTTIEKKHKLKLSRNI